MLGAMRSTRPDGCIQIIWIKLAASGTGCHGVSEALPSAVAKAVVGSPEHGRQGYVAQLGALAQGYRV